MARFLPHRARRRRCYGARFWLPLRYFRRSPFTSDNHYQHLCYSLFCTALVCAYNKRFVLRAGARPPSRSCNAAAAVRGAGFHLPPFHRARARSDNAACLVPAAAQHCARRAFYLHACLRATGVCWFRAFGSSALPSRADTFRSGG